MSSINHSILSALHTQLWLPPSPFLWVNSIFAMSSWAHDSQTGYNPLPPSQGCIESVNKQYLVWWAGYPTKRRGRVETKVKDNCHRKNVKFALSGFCSTSISEENRGGVERRWGWDCHCACQGCGSGSGSAWVRVNLSGWIRIRIQKGKNYLQI
jgi:hypothetical protein